MTREEREAFLTEVHVGILAVDEPGRGPLAMPTWYLFENGDVLIGLDGESGSGFTQPWTWWVDKQTGILLKSRRGGARRAAPRPARDAAVRVRNADEPLSQRRRFGNSERMSTGSPAP
jgi:hypothetical protein